LKLSELRVVAFAQFVKKSEKTIVTLWILKDSRETIRCTNQAKLNQH